MLLRLAATNGFFEGKIITSTLSSLKSQFTIPHEAITSDGGSKDQTVKIVPKYADKLVIYNEIKQKAILHGRSDGTRVAQGEFPLFINVDSLIRDRDSFFRAAVGGAATTAQPGPSPNVHRSAPRRCSLDRWPLNSPNQNPKSPRSERLARVAKGRIPDPGPLALFRMSGYALNATNGARKWLSSRNLRSRITSQNKDNTPTTIRVSLICTGSEFTHAAATRCCRKDSRNANTVRTIACISSCASICCV